MRSSRIDRISCARDERGVSVLEVTIASALLTLLMASAFGAFLSLQNASEGTRERGMNLSEGRLLMQQTTKDLRTATRLTSDTSPFVLATPTDVIFYGNINTNSAPKKVRLYVDDSQQLVEETTDADRSSLAPNYTYTGTPKTRFVGQYIVNAATDPPFTFYADDGSALPLDPGCGCVASLDLMSVRAVAVSFSIRHSTSLVVAPTTLVNRVRLPNLDYNEEAGA